MIERQQQLLAVAHDHQHLHAQLGEEPPHGALMSSTHGVTLTMTAVRGDSQCPRRQLPGSGAGEPPEDVLQPLRAAAQVDERVAVVGQPGGELRHQPRVRWSIDHVLADTNLAATHPDRCGQRHHVEAGAAAEADLVVAAAQLVERAVGDHLATVEDDDPIGDALGLVELVGGEHDRTPVGGEVADDVRMVSRPLTSTPGRGLVEERHVRPRGQRERQRQPLLLTAAQPLARVPWPGRRDRPVRPAPLASAPRPYSAP